MNPKGTFFYTKKTINIRGRLLDLSTPAVMGIINVTPDSFHKGSRMATVGQTLQQAGEMLAAGAAIVDVGGYSSRPGAADISPQEEMDRVLPVIEAIAKGHPQANISIDTFRATVAEEAVRHGAGIVNDISGGTLDEDMFATVARLQVPYILMHMRGTPQTMKSLNQYENLVVEVVDFLQKKAHQLHELKVKDIIIDPGFGFAKDIDQNFNLLSKLHCLKALNLPILAGVSRKSMIYHRLGITPEQALNGTTVLNTLALHEGASILRVHDVREAVEAVRLFKLTYP